MNFLVIAFLILGVLFIVIPLIVYAVRRKSEWYIWVSVALGALFLFIALIIYIVEETAKEAVQVGKSAVNTVETTGAAAGKDIAPLAPLLLLA